MLASPWKRLAASATDALLILAAHVFVWLVAGVIWVYPDSRFESVLKVLSPLACWLYVWIGWWRGATLGKKLWRLRVVTPDGAPPGAGRALMRCAGYVLASLPIKAGLLPIFYDSHRQGWHDRIARTLVIDANAPRKLSLPVVRKSSRSAPPELDWSAPRIAWPVMLVAYLTLSALMTFPVIAHLSTQLAGDNGDSGVFLWNLWFFQRAVSNGHSPLYTTLLFYPNGAPLLFHTMNWFHCVLALALLKVCNLTATYNLLFLLSFALCSFSMYWLCAALTRRRGASFVAALAFGFSPYFWAHGLGHMNLVAAEFLPLFVLWCYAALTTLSNKYSCLAGFALALCGYCDWQYALFAGLWLLCLLWSLHVAYESDHERFKARLRRAALIVFTGAFLLMPLLLPALRERQRADYMNKSGQASAFKADLGDFFVFNPFHPWNRDEHEAVSQLPDERDIGIGFIMLTFACIGALTLHRRLRAWLLCAVVFTVLACGPRLTLHGAPPCSGVEVIALGGVPGNGFDLPWDFTPLISSSQRMAANPFVLAQPSYDVSLPFSWLSQIVPLLKPFRTPARLVTGILLCVAVLAAFGLATLQDFLGAKRGTRTRALMVALAAALTLFEYWPYPYPTSPVLAHPFFARLGRDTQTYAIIEAPFRVSPQAMQLQTIHGKAIFLGNLARAPRAAFRLAANNALLIFLSPIVFQWRNKDASDVASSPPAQTLEAARDELRALNTRFIIIHKRDLKSGELEKYDAVLSARLKLPVIFDDGELRVYRL